MKVFNISDHPKFVSVDVKYKRGTIKPGQSVELDEELIPKAACVVLTLPPWYIDWKNSLQLPQKVVKEAAPTEIPQEKVEEKIEEKKRKKEK